MAQQNIDVGSAANAKDGDPLRDAFTKVEANFTELYGRVKFGEATLDGGNPTSVAHGLATCVSFVAILKKTSAPGLGTSVLTTNINGSNVDVYAWKPTSSSDPTLIASTGTESFYWIAAGTP